MAHGWTILSEIMHCRCIPVLSFLGTLVLYALVMLVVSSLGWLSSLSRDRHSPHAEVPHGAAQHSQGRPWAGPPF